MPRTKSTTTRTMLRAYQRARDAQGDSEFQQDLDFLQAKDLDLSVRLGALLAFDALLVTAAINPIAASPGAPLSLDASKQPIEVLAISIGIALLAASALLCVRAVMIGEDFSSEGLEDDPVATVRRMFAAYCASIDHQIDALARASRYTIAGGVVSAIACAWIMIEKAVGG
jgi:hypothetical protein